MEGLTRESRERVLALRRHLAARPEDLEARRELTGLYLASERFEEAARTGEPLAEGDRALKVLVAWAWAAAGEAGRALALLAGDPVEAHLLGELGQRCAFRGLWPVAEVLYRRAHALHPDDFTLLHGLVHSLDYLHRFEDSLALRRQALGRFGHPQAQALLQFGIGQTLLLQGQLAEGFEAMESRLVLPGAPALLEAPGNPWQGEPVAGRTLLVQWEQGYGDAFMVARHVPALAAAGARVLLGCPGPVASLLATCEGLEVLRQGDQVDLPADTLQVPMLSLPWRCGAMLDPAPWAGPYLTVPSEVPEADRLVAALDALPPGRKLGLCWEGSSAHVRDGERSLPAPLLEGLGAVPGIQWVNLTRSPRSRPDLPMLDLGDLDFAQVAFVLARLDGLVSVDSAYAHLAGAMGRPVDLLLHHLPDWRWLLDRTDSPWYPGHRLWRQSRPGDWHGVLAALGEDLGRRQGTVSFAKDAEGL